MDRFEVGDLPARLNADPEFVLAARAWDGSLSLVRADECIALVLADGRVSEGRAVGDEPGRGELEITGPREGWEAMLAPEPPAFHHDVLAAVSREGFAFRGDVETLYAYYPAIRRLVEVMRGA